jgi:hypothetical protein
MNGLVLLRTERESAGKETETEEGNSRLQTGEQREGDRFPEINTPNISPNMFGGRAILCPLNASVNKINGTATYRSVDYIASTNPNAATHFPTEFLNTIEISSLPLRTLTLKVDQPVILLSTQEHINKKWYVQ